jgi:hypothetical protein
MNKVVPFACRIIFLLCLFVPTARAVEPLTKRCPSALPEWEIWRNDWARNLSRFEPSVMQKDFLKFGLACIEKRKKDFKESPSAMSCVRRLVDFAEAMEKSRGGEIPRFMGFGLEDDQYLKKHQQHLEFPAELQKHGLLTLISKGDTEGAAKFIGSLNITRAKNGQMPIQLTRFTSTFTATEGGPGFNERFLVFIPGNPEKWINFPIPDSKKKEMSGHSVALISVFTDKNGKKTSYFRNLWRKYPFWPWESVHVTKTPEGQGIPGCFFCHKSGPLRINPEQLENKDPLVKRWNEGIALNYAEAVGVPDVLKGLPGIGEQLKLQERNDAFFERCAKRSLKPVLTSNKKQLYQKINQAMNCASCHDGQTRGKLVPPIRWLLLRQHVMSGNMPPDSSLTPAEREMLLSCLGEEYQDSSSGTPVLYEYLTSVRCTESPEDPAQQGRTPH